MTNGQTDKKQFSKTFLIVIILVIAVVTLFLLVHFFAPEIFSPRSDEIRKLQEVEVRVSDTVIDRSVTVFVDIVFFAVWVISDLVSSEALKTLVILLCPRVSDALEFRILSGRDKRLSVELDGKIRSQAEVHPQC